MKYEPLQGESCNANSLHIYEPRSVYRWNKHNTENQQYLRVNYVTYIVRYTSKLDGSKTSNQPINWVSPIYIHYEMFNEESTYWDATNFILLITLSFHAYVITNNSHSSFIHMGDCWVLKDVNEKLRIVKSYNFSKALWPFR